MTLEDHCRHIGGSTSLGEEVLQGKGAAQHRERHCLAANVAGRAGWHPEAGLGRPYLRLGGQSCDRRPGTMSGSGRRYHTDEVWNVND